ncbi:MAG: phosphoglycerate kinase [candidate division KSB1 bacterium]|nr:phosphoglycerate kinase [candidate division KSB1 bacterium]MDZ7295306.1 phosphoglycerate kinase [candidate division KSB1 bacterium]MDZ7338374.1 phosphoglycerate kinase [candidate division KSB1 bacterium]MDZ7378607.1 phosphoglycerate kinase [candidate division KSB1 bacterium]MDZ7385321.1 phosphoglycerate kinase [candidate division KSB1 bacterium]
MAKLSIDDLDLKGKRVLMRVDFNVPLTPDLKVADDTRIRAAVPSIKKVVDSGGMAILMSHLGRPKGQVKEEMRLRPAAVRLSEILGREVKMAPDCVGPEVEAMVAAMKPGDVLLLENLRFHKAETDNDPEFAKQLAKLGDVYVNDAFGSAHRAHASTEGVTKYFDRCAAGYLMQRELLYLSKALESPAKPFVAVMGGAKISDKIELIENFVGKVDSLLIGGGMAYTFLKAKGVPVGSSLVEEDKLTLAAQLLETAKKRGVELLLPVDHIVAKGPEAEGTVQVVDGEAIPEGMMGLDIGPKTTKLFESKILKARTVVWNGPLGMFEKPAFAKGTMEIARALAEATAKGAVTIVGGGDSAAAVAKANLSDKVSHVSTGGGASLEFLSGLKLPGVEALTEA